MARQYEDHGDPAWADRVRANNWSRSIDLGGYDLHYLDAGSGPAVIMIHGFGDSVYSWRWNIDAFTAEGFRVAAVDLPGMGQSGRPQDFAFTQSAMAGAVVGLMHGLDINRAVIVGNSLGGNVALYMAVHYPALVDRLVLVDPACYLLGPRQRLITSAARNPHVVRLVRPFVGPWIIRAAYWQAFYDSSLIRPEMVDESSQFLSRPDGRDNLIKTAGFYFGQEYKVLSRHYGEIHARTLLIWGEYDRVIPTRTNAEKLHNAIPGSELIIMSKVGHAPQQEQPEKFNRIVLKYLQTEK